MSLFAQKSRPEMVATIYGSSQAQLSERLGVYMRCDARLLRTQKAPQMRGGENLLRLKSRGETMGFYISPSFSHSESHLSLWALIAFTVLASITSGSAPW